MQIQASRIPMLKKVSMAVASLAALVGMAAAAIGVGALAPGDTVTYTPVPFDTSEWTADRLFPTGGVAVTSFDGRSNVLEMNVDATATPPSSTFYYYEGLKRDIDGATAVKADLYVDSNWPNAPTQAGIWGVGVDATDTVSAYPIVEYTTNNNGYTGWRAFDDFNGAWINFPGTPTNVDGWNTVEIVFNSDNTNFDLYVNETLVGSSVATGSTDLSDVILNNRNYYGDGESYTVRWSNLHTGVVTEDTAAPVVEITNPADGATLAGTVEVRGSVVDDNPWRYYTVVLDGNTVVAGPGTVYDSNSFTDQLLFNFDTTTVDDGEYTIRLAARDVNGNRDNSVSLQEITVVVNNVPDNKDQCKDGGWAVFSAMDFKNQGDCVSYVNHNDGNGNDDNKARGRN